MKNKFEYLPSFRKAVKELEKGKKPVGEVLDDLLTEFRADTSKGAPFSVVAPRGNGLPPDLMDVLYESLKRFRVASPEDAQTFCAGGKYDVQESYKTSAYLPREFWESFRKEFLRIAAEKHVDNPSLRAFVYHVLCGAV